MKDIIKNILIKKLKKKKNKTGRKITMEPVVKLIDKKNYKKHVFKNPNNKKASNNKSSNNNMNMQKGGWGGAPFKNF